MDKRTKQFILSLRWLLIFPAVYALTLLAGANPAFVEHVYSNAIYQFIAPTFLFQYIPFVSAFEVVVLLGPPVLIVCLVVFVVRLFKQKQDRLWRVLEVIKKTLLVCGVAYLLFYVFWGFNYYRLTYAEIADLPVEPSTTSELKELCSSLIDKTNAARALLPSAEDDSLDYALTTAELQEISQAAYAQACEDTIPGLSTSFAVPKPLKTSYFVSYTGITGIYIPYTAESNYNNDIPLLLQGANICHELAHRQGFAREDEANFIAYLVCTNAQDRYLNYSGYLLATIHSMNKLYASDHESFKELHALYSDEVAADLAVNNNFWHARSGEVEEITTRINDTYLKSHNLADGVESYGAMVDLLLAEQRELGR